MSDRRANVHGLPPLELNVNRNTAQLWNGCCGISNEYRVFGEAVVDHDHSAH
jgi:hypothetical protein